MRWLLLVLALTGCRQIFGIQDPDRFRGDAPTSTPDTYFVDARDDAMPVAPGQCDTSDTTLVGCWDFEGDLRDTSPNHLDAVDPGVVIYQTGKIGKAVDVNGTDAVVGETTLLDLTSVTIEAWINPKVVPPPGQRMGIVDNQGQYGLFLYTNGIRCYSGTTMVDLVIPVPTSAWTHVVCTSDGVHETAWVGSTKMSGTTTAIPATGTTGLSLGSDNPVGSGSRFEGLLDAIRLYSVVRADAEICADGQTAC